MKYLSLIACVSIFSVSVANAQLFVGGNIGFETSKKSEKTGSTTVDEKTTTNFSFNPMVGYFLSDKFAIGGELKVGSSKVKVPALLGTQETITKTSTFGVIPFVRYYAIQAGKFSIFGKGYMGLIFGKTKVETGGRTTDEPKTTTFEFGLTPGMSYNVSSKFALEAQINLLNLNYSTTTQKRTTNGTETKTTISGFDFGAGLDNIVTTGSIQVGAIYKF